MADDNELLYEVRQGAAWLTLNREKRRNALTPGMIDLLDESLTRAETDDHVRVVCITGRGDRAFCSGADLGAALGGDRARSGAAARSYARLLHRLIGFPKPLVARLNGDCLAGGMGLMLACDLTYAREGIRIGTPEAKVGLFPMMIGALIFRDAVRKKAMEMVYTGRLVTAHEAEAMGLITRVYPAEELDSSVDDTLAAIAANAPAAIRIGRQALAAAEEMDRDAALEFLCGQLEEVMATEDATEGIAAFKEKRAPQWRGR